jgi:transcriptional regulator NrdR family protein
MQILRQHREQGHRLAANEDGSAIRRRRECMNCGKRFTTYEKIEEIPIMVVKRDGRREPFDSEKIRNGIRKACEKRRSRRMFRTSWWRM